LKTGQNNELRTTRLIPFSIQQYGYGGNCIWFLTISLGSSSYFLCLETKKVTISPQARQGKKMLRFFCHEFSLLLSLFQDKESKTRT